MDKKGKVAWILPGGGGWAVYTAGCVYAAQKISELAKPDILIAASGGAGTACYFATEQYESIRNIWCKLLSTKKFVNFLRPWKFMDLDYLIDEVFQKIEPLDLQKFTKSDIEVFIGVTNTKDGKVKYIKADKNNIWPLLKATKSSPGFSGLRQKIFKLDGDEYTDSFGSSKWEPALKEAIKFGATEIVIFNNFLKESSTLSAKRLYKIFLLTRPRQFRRNQIKIMNKEERIEVPPGVKVVLLKPKKKFPLAPFSNKSPELTATFNQGLSETFEYFQSIQEK